MAPTREATAVWTAGGAGIVSTRLDSSQAARLAVASAEHADDTDPAAAAPEELLGAAHAADYIMTLAAMLADAGSPADEIQVTAVVTSSPGAGITGSHLLVNAAVPGIDDAVYREITEAAKDACPVSRALAGISVTLESDLA